MHVKCVTIDFFRVFDWKLFFFSRIKFAIANADHSDERGDSGRRLLVTQFSASGVRLTVLANEWSIFGKTSWKQMTSIKTGNQLIGGERANAEQLWIRTHYSQFHETSNQNQKEALRPTMHYRGAFSDGRGRLGFFSGNSSEPNSREFFFSNFFFKSEDKFFFG